MDKRLKNRKTDRIFHLSATPTTPFRSASVLRISFRRRDIGSGLPMFGSSNTVRGIFARQKPQNFCRCSLSPASLATLPVKGSLAVRNGYPKEAGCKTAECCHADT